MQILLHCERIVDSREHCGWRQAEMAHATLTISSKNYSSWSLRGWLLCRMAGLEFNEQRVDLDDPETRQELLLLSPSVLVPRLTHNDVTVWDTLAIAEYLAEIAPEAGLLPADQAGRRALPRGVRRDAFGLPQSALGAADEPQGAAQSLQDLFRRAPRRRADQDDLDANAWRPMAGPYLFGDAQRRRRHVRAGLHQVPHLRRRARSGACRPIAKGYSTGR